MTLAAAAPREVVFTFDDGEKNYVEISPESRAAAKVRRVVDVVLEVPIETQSGRLLETVELAFQADVPKTDTPEFVRYKGTLAYGRNRVPIEVELPCDLEYTRRFRVRKAPVRVKPRERREIDLERDGDGQVAASYQAVY